MFRPDQSLPLKGAGKVSRLFVAVKGVQALIIRNQRDSEVHESSVFRFCINSHTSGNLMPQRTTEVRSHRWVGGQSLRDLPPTPHAWLARVLPVMASHAYSAVVFLFRGNGPTTKCPFSKTSRG